MKRILLALLMFTATSAWAEWVQVGSADNFDTYIDPATIRRSGDKVKMWYLYDFKTTQVDAGQRYLSSKIQDEYDCKDERSRILYATAHSEQIGGGNVVYSHDGIPSNWRPIAPGSVNETLWRAACEKK